MNVLPVLLAQLIQTVVGNGSSGFAGDGGPAVKASIAAALDNTCNVAFDRDGNLYLADTSNHRIRRVDARKGLIETVAGTGEPGFGGDGGPARAARLYAPSDLAFDGQGRLVVADAGNNRVRRIDLARGTIETVAGTGTANFNGDGIPASSASLARPSSVAVDPKGNLFIADTLNARVRLVDAKTGLIWTYAGDGTVIFMGDGRRAIETPVSGPVHVRLDAGENVLIADASDHLVLRVDGRTGQLAVLAGDPKRSGFEGDGGPARDAVLNQPIAVAVDRAGNVYIADWQNHRVRRVDRKSGRIETVAGNGAADRSGVAFFAGDGGPARDATLGYPAGLAFDRSGNLYIVDALNSRVRRVKL